MAAKYFDTITAASGPAIFGAVVSAVNSLGAQATLYSDKNLTVSLGTTATTDIDGYVEFYVPDGVYTITQTYNGVSRTLANIQIYDLTNFADASQSTSAAVSATSAAASATAASTSATAAATSATGAATSATSAASALASMAPSFLPSTPVQFAPGALTEFGQENADNITGLAPRYINLPTGATTPPADTSDWFIAIHCRTGRKLWQGQYEVLANSGASISHGSNTRNIMLWERGTGQPWTWDFTVSHIVDLFTTCAPAMNTLGPVEFGDWCVIVGVSGLVPYFAAVEIGGSGQSFFAKGLTAGGFNTFYFPAAQYTTATLALSGGVLTLNQASIDTTYTVGTVCYISSVDQPSINGVYTVASRLAGNAGLTFTGPSGTFTTTAANASICRIRTGLTDIFNTLGATSAPIGSNSYGWAGGIQRIEMRYGTMPINSVSGQIDQVWATKYANRQFADSALPGTKHFACTTSAVTSYAADADGTVTTACTVTGAPRKGRPVGTDWLLIPDRPGIFASDYSANAGNASTGTLSLPYFTRERISGLLGYVTNSAGAVIVPEVMVSNGPDNTGHGTIQMSFIPNGTDMNLVLRPSNAVSGYSFTYGPFSIGPVIGVVSQSTWNVPFAPATTGSAVAPLSTTTGVAHITNIIDGLSDTGTNYTNQPVYCRTAHQRIAWAGQAGDAIVQAANTLITRQNTATGNASCAELIDLCRSGHAADIYWADRQALINSCGTATAGVTFAGTWLPHPLYTPTALIWTNPADYAPTIWRGGTLAQSKSPFALNGSGSTTNSADPTDPYVLIGGVLVGTVQNNPDGSGNCTISGAVAGTFNINTGAYSILDPVGGLISIQARMWLNTHAGTMAGSRPAITNAFTCWGSDTLADSGQISDMLKQQQAVTAFMISWGNYLLSYASTATQAQVNAKIAFDYAMIRKRIDTNYPALAGKPWIVHCDPRTTGGSSLAEQQIRNAMRAYAKATPNTFWTPSAITADMDGITSPHPGSLTTSGQLWGITLGHTLADVLGYGAANAPEVYLIGASRSGGTVTLTFNNPVGTSLVTNDGSSTFIEGVYYGPTDQPLLANQITNDSNHTFAITAYNQITCTLGTGNWPAAQYFNVNLGCVLTDTTLANETTRLNRTLAINNGGFQSIRPGMNVSFAPSNVYCA
jgi:hypothetical protein